ncbi:MAG: alpha/beta fold hydrolase [Saccharofermentans sp.]|nr:alpha/beta fold hydrolase [Saccharofermentans sp.]
MGGISSHLSILITLLILVVALLGGALYFAYLTWCKKLFLKIFKRPQPMPRIDRSPREIDQSTVFGKGKNWFYSTRNEYINVRIQSFDKTKLSGYFRPSSDRSSRFAVILLHGYNEHPSEMAAYAKLMMKQMQCHILIPHMRAHCMSGGKYCTYGLYESVDLLKWIDFVKAQVGDDCRIFLVGRCMGADAALLAAAQEGFSPNVAGIIADCPFDSLYNVLMEKGKLKYKINMKFPLKTINKIASKNLGCEIEPCDAVQNAKLIRVPVLFFGAGSDTVVPEHSAKRIYDDIRTPKHLVMVDNCQHLMCYDRSPAAFEREVRKFVEQCVVRMISIGKM